MSRWQDLYPNYFENNRYYLNMLGQPGSSAMDLFWDVVEDAYEMIYERRKTIEAYFKVCLHNVSRQACIEYWIQTIRGYYI